MELQIQDFKCIHIAVFKRSLHCRAFYDSLIWFALWKVQFIIAYINLVAEESEISKYRQNGSALQENIFPLVLFWRCRVCTHKMTSGNGAKMQCLWDKGHPSSATSNFMLSSSPPEWPTVLSRDLTFLQLEGLLLLLIAYVMTNYWALTVKFKPEASTLLKQYEKTADLWSLCRSVCERRKEWNADAKCVYVSCTSIVKVSQQGWGF